MSHLTSTERRWRTIALNPKAPLKMRLSALEHMKNLSDRFLCSLLRKCKGSLKLTFAANLKLQELREAKFREFQRELAAKYARPSSDPQPSVLDI
jgi:hypothetical protein